MSRVTWLSRGTDPGKLGSARDLVLRELLDREKALRVAEVSMMARLVGVAAGVKSEALEKVLGLYFDEITHSRYAAKPRGTKAPAEDEITQRLARVAALSSSG